MEALSAAPCYSLAWKDWRNTSTGTCAGIKWLHPRSSRGPGHPALCQKGVEASRLGLGTSIRAFVHSKDPFSNTDSQPVAATAPEPSRGESLGFFASPQARHVGSVGRSVIGDDSQDWAIVKGECASVNSRVQGMIYERLSSILQPRAVRLILVWLDRCTNNVLYLPYDGFDSIQIKVFLPDGAITAFTLSMALANDASVPAHPDLVNPTCIGAMEDRGPVWYGRWGTWGDSETVCLLAPVVAVLEASFAEPRFEDEERWARLLEAAGAALQSDMAGTCVLAAVHWKPVWLTTRQRLLHAHIIGNLSACEAVRRTLWSGKRGLLEDQAWASWSSTFDTADLSPEKKHGRARLAALRLWEREPSPGLALELPVRWVPQGMVEDAANPVSALRPGCHWQRFFELFGELLILERVLRDSGRIVLLALFERASAALAMYETLAGRCLYWPCQARTPTFPAICTLRDYDVLKAQLCRGEPVQDDEAAYILRRLDGEMALEWPNPVPPEVLLITTNSPAVVCGRDGPVALRLAHVSKAHAVLRLFRDTSSVPASWKLTVQDTSSNGTWVNGIKLKPKTQQELKLHDQVCFVPPAPNVRQLIYQVMPGSVLLRPPAPALVPLTTSAPGVLQPPQSPESMPKKRPRLQDDSLSSWLVSLGDPAVLRYEHQLCKMVPAASELRDAYAYNISGFLAELGVQEEHKATFRPLRPISASPYIYI
ncbi:unnamed protein product [Symbiodinium necroappetens]|uniref:FHA domain-containing protein n=1 Tax=Symbiodinium necroappetens TaxID=1628268 RepID=A0A812S1F9_9DINO|nr:unnamed protein product [Symbiodinium necroappetens]